MSQFVIDKFQHSEKSLIYLSLLVLFILQDLILYNSFPVQLVSEAFNKLLKTMVQKGRRTRWSNNNYSCSYRLSFCGFQLKLHIFTYWSLERLSSFREWKPRHFLTIKTRFSYELRCISKKTASPNRIQSRSFLHVNTKAPPILPIPTGRSLAWYVVTQIYPYLMKWHWQRSSLPKHRTLWMTWTITLIQRHHEAITRVIRSICTPARLSSKLS